VGIRFGADRILASELKRDSGLRKGDQVKIIRHLPRQANAFYFSTNPLAPTRTRTRSTTADHQLRLERGLGSEDEPRRSRLNIEMAIRSASCASRERGRGGVGLEPVRIILRRTKRRACRSRASGRRCGFSRVERAGVLGGSPTCSRAASSTAAHTSRRRCRVTTTPAHPRYTPTGLDARIGLVEPAGRPDVQDRLRAGRGRPGGRQPHAVFAVLPEAAVLHRERGHVRLRHRRPGADRGDSDADAGCCSCSTAGASGSRTGARCRSSRAAS
jgi:hypothetical protein